VRTFAIITTDADELVTERGKLVADLRRCGA
jgi:hypothetical protein